MQLEQENQSLLNKVDNLEGIRMSSQKQLSQTEEMNKELHLEKMQLEQLLQKAEVMQEDLQEELRVLRIEQKETHEELSQVCTRRDCCCPHIDTYVLLELDSVLLDDIILPAMQKVFSLVSNKLINRDNNQNLRLPAIYQTNKNNVIQCNPKESYFTVSPFIQLGLDWSNSF